VSFTAITLCVASQRVIPNVSAYLLSTQSGKFWIYPRTCRTVLHRVKSISCNGLVRSSDREKIFISKYGGETFYK
jgi:hypothetical protein